MKKHYYHNYLVTLSIVLGNVVLGIQTTFALAYCITDPIDFNGDDNRCPLTVEVLPDSSNLSSGGSTSITFRATGIFESGNNSFAYFDTWKIEDVTGVFSSPIHVGGLPTAGTFTRTAYGNSGVLTRGVTVTLSAGTAQGVDAYDSEYIAVTTPPPTVDIHFSFLRKVGNFFSDFFITKVFASK